MHQLEDGEHAQDTQTSRDSQQAEAIVDEGQSREYRQHIHNAGQRERITDKGPDTTLTEADVCRYPVQQVVDNEHRDHHHIRDSKYGVILLEGQRQHADDNQYQHKLIVQARSDRIHLLQLHNVVYPLPYHTICLFTSPLIASTPPECQSLFPGPARADTRTSPASARPSNLHFALRTS